MTQCYKQTDEQWHTTESREKTSMSIFSGFASTRLVCVAASSALSAPCSSMSSVADVWSSVCTASSSFNTMYSACKQCHSWVTSCSAWTTASVTNWPQLTIWCQQLNIVKLHTSILFILYLVKSPPNSLFVFDRTVPSDQIRISKCEAQQASVSVL